MSLNYNTNTLELIKGFIERRSKLISFYIKKETLIIYCKSKDDFIITVHDLMNPPSNPKFGSNYRASGMTKKKSLKQYYKIIEMVEEGKHIEEFLDELVDY